MLDIKKEIAGIDFGLWERKCGRPLADIEKFEIKRRLSEFFSLLEQEYNDKPHLYEDIRQKVEAAQVAARSRRRNKPVGASSDMIGESK